MPEPRALVRNAADKEQVKQAKETEQFIAERDQNDLRLVLSSKEGRRMLWRFLSTCGVFQSIYDGHGGRMSFNAGRHDLGLWLMGQIIAADQSAYLVMQAEAAKLDREIVEPSPKVPE